MFSKAYSSKLIISCLMVLSLSILLFSCATPSIIATQSIQTGDRANNENNYDLAIQHYETYLETAPSLGTMRNPIMEAQICRKLAHCYSVKGDYQRAKRSMRLALQTDSEQADNQLNVIEDYRQLGITCIYTGEYDSALYFLDQAMQLNEGMESSLKAVKRISIADTYLSRGQLKLSMGLFRESRQDAQKAVNIYEDENNDVGRMEAYLVLAKLAVATNKLDEANDLVRKSIDVAKIDNYKLYRQYQVLADINIQLGLPEEAIIARTEALQEARNTNIVPQIIWACLRLGDAYNELGDQKKANRLYREARDLEKQLNQSSSLTPSIQMRLGDLQNAYDLFNSSGGALGSQIATLNLLEEALSINDSDSAIALLEQTIVFFKDQEISEGVGKALIMQSVIYKNKEAYEKSLARLFEAEKLALRPDLAWKVKYNLALVSHTTGHDTEARQYLDQAIAIIEQQRNTISRSEFKWHYLDQKTDVYDTYISLLLSQKKVSREDIVKSFELNERARSRTFLDMLLEQNIISTDPDISHQIALIQENQQLLTRLEENRLKGIPATSLEIRFQENEAALSRLEEQEKHMNFTRLHAADLVTLEALQKQMAEDEVILEFWTGREQLVSWKITNRDISFSRSETTNSDLHKSIAGVRNMIKFGIEDRIVGGFQDLNTLLAPVLGNVFDEHPQVTVIPHGPLHFIPLEALHDGNQFVVEKSSLRYAPSAAVYHFTSNVEASVEKNNLLGMALGDLALEDHQGLPGTKMEVEQLSQFYDDNNCLFEDAISESYFKENAGKYDLIHLASHGVFNRTKPGRSFVLMAPTADNDGKLMVDEIYDLNLNAQLVALSACETGLGDLSEGDELVGLSRAFLYAGTSAIIVSLWKVDDLSTSILMTRLHQLIEAGVNPDDALTIAKRDLLKANFSRAKVNSGDNNSLYPEMMGDISKANRSLGNVRGPESISWHPDLIDIVKSSESIHTSPYYWAPFIIIGGRPNNN